ncbi:hypothetical protein KY285_007395 [Solanum tuberosum]|nr:hypothetical protein KY285_007395 [Solanum tuberosum]
MAVILDPAKNTTQQRLLGLGLLHHDNFQDNTPSIKPIHSKIPFFTKHLQHPGRIYLRVGCFHHIQYSGLSPPVQHKVKYRENDYAILKIQLPLVHGKTLPKDDDKCINRNELMNNPNLFVTFILVTSATILNQDNRN